MSTTTLIRVAGLLGGGCLLGQAIASSYDSRTALLDGLYWGGAALVLVYLVGIGAGLVSGAAWLRVIVAVCFPLLVASVLAVFYEQVSDRVVDGFFGFVIALVCASLILGSLGHQEQDADFIDAPY